MSGKSDSTVRRSARYRGAVKTKSGSLPTPSHWPGNNGAKHPPVLSRERTRRKRLGEIFWITFTPISGFAGSPGPIRGTTEPQNNTHRWHKRAHKVEED